jgi:hypothetical protein
MIRGLTLIIFLLFNMVDISASESTEYQIKKIVSAYKLEDGLYEISRPEENQVLYLFKNGTSITMHDSKEVYISSNCKDKEK